MRGIRRVEGRFPIGEFRMLLVKRFEIMNGGIGGDRLRIELFILKPIKDGRNLLRGIVTNGLRTLHEQARLFQNLLFLFRLKDRCSYKSKKDKSQSSDSQEHKVELSSDTHPSDIHDARLSSDLHLQRVPHPELKRRSVTLSISMPRNQDKCDPTA
jgi:hypothetical protein